MSSHELRATAGLAKFTVAAARLRRALEWNATMNFGSIASNLQAKAQEVASMAKDTQRRMTQQALEAAGMAEKTEDDSVPELAQHARMERFLRKLYEHTDSYMRSVNGMMEASKALAEDFADVLDEPALAGAADSRRDGAAVPA